MNANAHTDEPTDELGALLAQRGDPDRDPDGDQDIVAVDAVRVQLVVFTIGDRRFALPGPQVTEILALTTVYPVPGCPAAVEGVIDVRGRVCAVLRLGDLLDSPHAAASKSGAFLLGSAAGMESGLRVDRVEDVCDVIEAGILPPPEHLPERLRALVSGVVERDGTPVIVLDLARLFQAWRDGRI